MRSSLKRLIESLLPFETEKKTSEEIILKVISKLEELPILLKIGININSLIFNFLLFRKFKFFYFCNLDDRKKIVYNSYISNLFDLNILRLLRTFTWMCFYDHPDVHSKINYKNEKP